MQFFSLNLPNSISISRMLMVVVIIAFLFQPDENLKICAFLLSIIIVPLDGLDGYLARKYKQETKSGAFLDIINDRLVESFFWLSFALLGIVSVWVPIIIIGRGLITDTIRNYALKKGYEPFKMLHSKITIWLVASRFNRFFYAFLKAVVFPWLILEYILASSPIWYSQISNILVVLTVAYCLLRGLPVIWDAQYLLKHKKK